MIFGIAILLAIVLCSAIRADNTETDPSHKYAWGENTGWANAGPTNQEVTVHFNGDTGWLSGYAWGENIGWIVIGSSGGGPYENTTSNNWGVNLASTGNLSGYAWGENVGWINFGHAYCDAAIDPATGNFSGHAWGENIGWLTFSGTSPDYGVRTLAFDTQAHGTPNWWLDNYGVTEDFDAGDGVAAWQKYVMDCDPDVIGDYLQFTTASDGSNVRMVSFSPVSPQRYYSLIQRQDMKTGSWSNVPGCSALQYGTAGEKTLQVTNTDERTLFRMKVTVTP